MCGSRPARGSWSGATDDGPGVPYGVMHKVERLVNLIALLLNTRRPLTVEEIRNTVPGYQQEDYSSFKRMFERDKEELRSLGIPIERRFTDVWEVEEGYLISKDRYYLPELELTPDEMAALWIASQHRRRARRQGGPGSREALAVRQRRGRPDLAAVAARATASRLARASTDPRSGRRTTAREVPLQARRAGEGR